MDTYTVSFFGHRRLTDALTIEQRLEALIRQLLTEKEYVEFLVGRDGEFDLLVASVIRRCKREIRSDNSSLIWVLPYETVEYRNNEDSFRAYYDEIEICEESAQTHYKNAYRVRNQHMVNRSDMVIFCHAPQGWCMADVTVCDKNRKSLPKPRVTIPSANPVKSDYNSLARRSKNKKPFVKLFPF